MANEFIARKGLIVLANGAKVTGSLGVQGDIDATGYNVTASNLSILGSASIAGDITVGGNLTVGNADLDVVKFLAEVSSSIVPDVNNAFDLGSGSKYWRDLYVSGTAYVNNIEAKSTTGSFTGSFTGNVTATTFSFDIDNFGSDLTGITVAGTDKLLLSDNGTDGRINVSQLSDPLAGTGLEASSGTIRVSSTAAGDGLTGGSGIPLSVDTSSAHFTGGVKTKLNTEGVFSSSVQTDVRNTTGIATIATTGSNTFIGSQTVFGNIFLSGSNRLVYNNTDDTSLLFGFYDGSTIRGPYYQIFGNNYSNVGQRGSAEFVFDTRNGGDANFHLSSYDGNTWVQRFRVDVSGSQVTGSLSVTGGITGSILSTNGVVSSSAQVTALLPTGTVSSSVQVDVRNTTGIETIATTGSNLFTGTQSFSNTTNSTNFADGAVVISGGVGIAKDVNISGSLTVTGLLSAVSMSTQYVTSSQYVIGTSRVIVNDNDIVRFAGLSVIDSGSTYGTGSLLWDSLYNRWIYQADDQAYNSAIIIAGPQNTGSLGDEVGLTTGRVVVAVGEDHIDSRPSVSPLRIAGTTVHADADVYVTGSVTASAFSGDGSNLTGIVTNLNLTGSQGGTGTVSLKTQDLTVTGINGVAATVSGQTITISGSNATTTAKGVASFTGSNFTVTGGEVSAKAITFNGVPLDLGSSYSFGLQNITPQGATTADQVTLNGGAIIHGVLFTSGSNTDVDSGTEVIASVSTGSYDAAYFDYVVKKGSNYRAGTVTAVWEAGTSNVEFTDVSTNDLGNTSDVILSVDLLSATARLKATVSSDNWIIKTAVRAL